MRVYSKRRCNSVWRCASVYYSFASIIGILQIRALLHLVLYNIYIYYSYLYSILRGREILQNRGTIIREKNFLAEIYI